MVEKVFEYDIGGKIKKLYNGSGIGKSTENL